jgi:hypothetical protein
MVVLSGKKLFLIEDYGDLLFHWKNTNQSFSCLSNSFPRSATSHFFYHIVYMCLIELFIQHHIVDMKHNFTFYSHEFQIFLKQTKFPLSPPNEFSINAKNSKTIMNHGDIYFSP